MCVFRVPKLRDRYTLLLSIHILDEGLPLDISVLFGVNLQRQTRHPELSYLSRCLPQKNTAALV